MIKWLPLRLVAAALAALSALPAFAVDGVYTVEGIRTEATAADAVTARAEAIAAAERDGLRQLLRRLSDPAAHGRLPDVEQLQAANYVSNFEITEEQVGSTSYRATMTIAYRSDAVRELLRGGDVAFLEERAPPLLVLPLYETPAQLLLWEEGNAWQEALADALRTSALVPLTLPLGDLADVTDVSAPQALSLDQGRLAALAGRYNVADVLVAHAQVPSGEQPARVRVEATRGQPGFEPVAVVVEGEPGEDPQALLRRAANELQDALDAQWKRDNLLRYDAVTNVYVRVPLASLADWTAISRSLDAMPQVSSTEVVAFGRDLAELDVEFRGTAEQFERALARDGLRLMQEGDSWLLLQTGANPAVPGTAREPARRF